MSLFTFSPHRPALALLSVLMLLGAPVISSGQPDGSIVQLKLANGDQVTGNIIKQTETDIIFSSPTLGELTIPRSALASAEKAPPVITDSNTSQPAVQGMKPESQPWRSKVEFGLFMSKGQNNTVQHNILAEAEKTFGRNNLLAKGSLSYVETDKQVTTNQTKASVRWRRNFGNRTFTQLQTSYLRDSVAGIALNLEQNVGIGYRLIDREHHTLNIGSGLTAQYRDADNITRDNGALTEFFQDQSYKLNDLAKIVQSLTLQYWPAASVAAASNPNADNVLKWRLSTTLVSKFTEQLSLNLSYNYDYDNAIADPAARTDQRISSSLGYEF